MDLTLTPILFSNLCLSPRETGCLNAVARMDFLQRREMSI